MRMIQLSKCNEFIKDGTHGSPDRTDEGVPVLSASNVFDGKLSFATDRLTTVAELEAFRKRLHPKPGDVLLTIVGSIGRTAILHEDRPLVFQRSVCVLRPKKNALSSEFLRYALESDQVRLQLLRETRQVAQAGVYLESLKNIIIPLPPLEEQQRIAAVLAKADRLRQMRRYTLQLGDTYLQSVFLQMFGRREHHKKTFGEIALKRRGAFTNGPFGSNLLTSELVPKGVPVIYIRDIREGRYERVSTVCVTPEKAAELDTCQVESGDVLIAKVGDPPGVTAIYPKGLPVGIITQDVIRIKLNQKIVRPEYLAAFMNSKQGYDTLLPIMVQGTRERFGLTPFKQLSLPVPPIDQQEKFACVVQQYERLWTQQREAARQADYLFDTLLHRAFCGEL